jgi:amidase
LALAVQRGDTSATEVVADHLEHARLADRVLDALRALRDGEAIAEAEMVDELPDLANLPLAGVPVLVKENTPIAGLPTWNGSAAARTAVADRDHEIVRRLRGAGAVAIGLSRMSELGLWATTDDASAVTRNPWRTDRSPGGSSGGAAAAVAAGVVPIAHGTDDLGSVRIPAACCGLIGFKPGWGVAVPESGVTGWGGPGEHGILATTSADAAVAFAVLAGRDPVEPPETGRLRLAVSLRSPVPGVRPDHPARAAVARAARLLAGAGHDVVGAQPRYPVRFVVAGVATWCAMASDAVGEGGAFDAPRLQPRTRRHAELGALALRYGLVRAGERALWQEQCVSWFRGRRFDLMVIPTLAGSPPPAESVRGAGWSARSWSLNAALGLTMTAFTAPRNLAGLPAVAVPMVWVPKMSSALVRTASVLQARTTKPRAQ